MEPKPVRKVNRVWSARALSRETRFGAREWNGQKLLTLHKQEREAAALGGNKTVGIAASYGEGRARCAAVGREPEDRGRLGFEFAGFSS
jgi:hypothetical protein